MDMTTIWQLYNHGQWQTCIESCLKAVMNDYTNIEAWSVCALCYGKLSRNDEAIECLQEAIKIDKEHGKKHNFSLSLNLAEFYRRNNMTLQAIALLQGLLPRDDENLHFNLAKCYGDMQDYERSIEHYMIAIKLNPKDVHAIFNLANQQAAMGSFKLALKYYALAYEGGMGDAGINLAQIHTNLDNLQEAIQIYSTLETYYHNDANFYFNYANALRYNLDFEASKQAYAKAISLHGDVRYIVNFSHLLLSLNDFENGFLLYEHRKTLIPKNMPKHFLDSMPARKNELLAFLKDKKVALYHEQGFGDSLMFARFVHLLDCKEKILFMPKELCSLFECFHLPCTDKMHGNYDVALPLPSLAFLFAMPDNIHTSLQSFRTTLLNFLCTDSTRLTHASDFLKQAVKANKKGKIKASKVLQSYEVQVDDTKISQSLLDTTALHTVNTQNKVAQGVHVDNIQLENNQLHKIKIGLNFASNPNFQNAREKSIYPYKLLEALPKDKFEYYSLQYEGLDSDLTKDFQIIDMAEHIKTFTDSATIILQMDFIISIDSALAHLSASLGVPTAVLLYKRHDWRWGSFGSHDSTIWYDNVFLFIQQELHEWNHVLLKLKEFLCRQDFEERIAVRKVL